MSGKIIRAAGAVLALVLLALTAPQASAQTYPNRPVRLVIPFGAGGSIDILARLLAQSISADWGQQMIVENQPGADGDIGAANVAKATPDGYTLVASSQAIAVNVSLHPVRPFDVNKDLTPIMLIGSTNSVLFASPVLNANSVADVVRAAKEKPGKLNYASQGLGTSTYLSMELFKLKAGIDVTHIPYKEYSQQTTDLLSGDVAMFMVTIPQTISLMGAGKVKPLGVSGLKRSQALPDVPTISDAGVPGYEAVTWYGLYGPGSLPRPIVDRVNAGFKKALESPDVKAKLVTFGVDSVASTPEQLKKYLDEELAKWADVVKRTGMPVQ